MNQIIFIFMSLLCFSCSSKAQNQTADTNVQSDKKILVAYFSCTGTTEKVADAIAKTIGGKLYRITPVTAYTSADLDWNNKSSRSSIEMTTENSRPELGGEALDLKDYDVVFLGYPIWWNLCPRPVNTFLEKYDFSGKTVIPFATSGGSSITNSVKQLKKLYPKITWGEGQLLNGSVKQAGEWAKGVI
ncbi:flavodoxin [Phocaeicola sp.]|uniref:flavodoxin n=1 Tax=Phocaeicola sp. TaxID=2773926 RepID=UPI003AAF5726